MFSELPLTHVIPVPGCKTRFPILHTAVSRPSCFAPGPEEKHGKNYTIIYNQSNFVLGDFPVWSHFMVR